MKTILLKFAGPMQSWGTKSHYDQRHTDGYPSKSAVLGLIAASLGWNRDDTRIASLNALQFAVRVDQPGHVREDYHTAHSISTITGHEGKYLAGFYEGQIKVATYITHRYYLEDAVFLVAVGSGDEKTIETILKALKSPVFQPYMGRRSCPLPIDFLQGVVDASPLEALTHAKWQAAQWFQKDQRRKQNCKNRLSIYADYTKDRDADYKLLNRRHDYVLSLSSKGRRYTERLEGEKVIEVEIPNMHAEHDAFGALGGE